MNINLPLLEFPFKLPLEAAFEAVLVAGVLLKKERISGALFVFCFLSII